MNLLSITLTDRPCLTAVEWAASMPDAETAWRECRRPDWMCWLLGHSAADLSPSEWRLLACDFAETAVQYADPESAAVCEGVIEVARRHALGDASDEELSAALASAESAASAASRSAASAASRSAASAASRSAAWSASSAADSAAWSATMAAGRSAALSASGDLIRAAVPWSRVAEALGVTDEKKEQP